LISRARFRTLATVTSFATGAFLAAPTLAAEAAEHGGEHAKQTFLGLPYEIFWTLNLVVFLGLLAKFAGPALVKFLEGKQQDLAHAENAAVPGRDQGHDEGGKGQRAAREQEVVLRRSAARGAHPQHDGRGEVDADDGQVERGERAGHRR